jgi:hypothetical protein
VSEYQYYEFLAVDRPLTTTQMGELRSFSTRARITPTSFVNEYSWGSFKGDEERWMEQYFDAFLYVANWGTRTLKLALPHRLLGLTVARGYCAGDCVSARSAGGKTILSFDVEDSEDDEWMDPEGWLSSFVSIRAELAHGDLRALYLGWLLRLQQGEVDEKKAEPLVPPGLAALSAPLAGFVDFFSIDKDLVAAAAAASRPITAAELTGAQMKRWVASLSGEEKDDLLLRLIAGERTLGDELHRRMRTEDGGAAPNDVESTRRSAGELLRSAGELMAQRERAETEAAAKAKRQRERAAAAARKEYLDGLTGREPAIWMQVNELIATRPPSSYDEAVRLLVDLQELSARGDAAVFRRRIEALRAEDARKPSLIGRLDSRSLG